MQCTLTFMLFCFLLSVAEPASVVMAQSDTEAHKSSTVSAPSETVVSAEPASDSKMVSRAVPSAHEASHAGALSADIKAKILNAMSSAPPSIATHATILDWPPGAGEPMPVLRAGSNGWTCLPDMHHTVGNDPMCIDGQWLEFIDAMGSRRAPDVDHLGFGYMLQANDSPYSNTDPFAAGPTPDNEWQDVEGPHLMVLVPDETLLDGMSRDPNSGGPWVMFDGTPYVHIMAPMPQYVPEKDEGNR